VAKPIALVNGRQWRTRTAAHAHFKEMLGRYKLDDVVPQGNDHEDLLALLKHYDRDVGPGQPTKIGAGVEYFSKGQARGEGFTNECFFVHRIDNTFDDFSCIKAVNS
jgi:hypothetical protein